jgi:hypothetical protein
MKSLAALISFLSLACSGLCAGPNALDLQVLQRDATNSFNGANWLGFTGDGVVGYNASLAVPVPLLLSSDLVISSGTLTISNSISRVTSANSTASGLSMGVAGNTATLSGTPTTISGNITQSQVTNLVADLAGKFPNPSGTSAQYVRGDGVLATLPASGSGTVTSVGLSSTDFTVSGSPVTTSGSITANLNTVGTAGTYSGVTTDSKGRVTAGTTRSFNNTASKTLVTSATGQGGTVLDASRDAAVTYSVSTSTTATIGGASSVTVYLEIATTNSATASDWTAIQTVSNGQTITLAVVLQSVQTNVLTVSGIVPAGYYMRVRYATTGTASASYVNGQEVKL